MKPPSTSNGEIMQVATFDGELLRDIPPGTWVAISAAQDRVAGTGATIDEALASAREHGETEPSILRVPLNSNLIL
ncbi:MAG TPA: hypothetical protein VI636_13795 [Candidatus Angelobacter sp.]